MFLSCPFQGLAYIILALLICVFLLLPFVILCASLLQAGSLAFYILSTLFFDSFVIIFVVTVLLAALDFWVVKNVSGRILVGLRWWNEINDLGESVWKFECLDQEVSFLHYNTINLYFLGPTTTIC